MATSLDASLAKLDRDRIITPLLSIVTPVFNGAEFMERGLGSVKAALQLLPKAIVAQIEVVVCDNHSTDQSLAIARSFTLPCAYRIIQPPEHYANRTLNWNFALNTAQGHWLLMLHADDMLVTEGLASVLKACQAQLYNARVVLMQGQHQNFDGVNAPQRKYPLWPLPALIKGSALNNKLMPFNVPFIPLLVIRTSTFKQANGFNACYELVQDWEMWWRLLKVGDLYYYPTKMGRWYMNLWTPKYKARIVQEHIELASHFQELNPTLSEATLTQAIRLQIAKARQWLPEISIDTWTAQFPKANLFALTEELDAQQANAIIQQNGRRFKIWVYSLLAWGSLRWAGFKLNFYISKLEKRFKNVQFKF